MSSTGYPLIINKSHHIGGGRYSYRFGRAVDFSEIDIALGSCSVYYSWRNVTSALNNNSFKIIHPTTAGNDTLTITLPDGGYEISDLNNYLRWYLVSNGYYIYNTTTLEQKVFAELRVNASTYSIEYVSYPCPTAIPAGWAAGASFSVPATTRAPQLTILSTNSFGVLIGYAAGNFPAAQQIVLTTSTSTLTPVLTEVLNVLLTLDVVDNPFAPNSSVIHALSSAGVAYGHLITSEPTTLSFIPCQKSARQDIVVQFVDQNMLPLEMVDYDVVVKLILARKETKNPPM